MELNIPNTHGAFPVAIAKEIQRSNSPSCSDNEEEHFLKELQETRTEEKKLGNGTVRPNSLRKWTVRDVPLQTYRNAFGLSTLRLILSVHKSSAPSNNSIRQLRPVPLGLRQRPYDSPLQKIPYCHQPLWMRCWLTCHVASSWSEQVSAQRPPEQLHVSNASEMFLRPAVVPTGEKVLRIVVFIDSIIPRDEVHVLSYIGTTKIYEKQLCFLSLLSFRMKTCFFL